MTNATESYMAAVDGQVGHHRRQPATDLAQKPTLTIKNKRKMNSLKIIEVKTQPDELRSYVQKNVSAELIVASNIAYVMADVTESMLLDVHNCLLRRGCDYKHEAKLLFGRMRTAVEAARRATNAFTKELYQNAKVADIMCNDSDYLQEIIWLLVDIVGDSPEREAMVRNTLLQMQSAVGLRFANRIREKYNNNNQ